jgi:hypothetical protein
MLERAKTTKGEKKVSHMFTDERFKDVKKSKSKMNVLVPGPGNYQMIA